MYILSLVIVDWKIFWSSTFHDN